MSRGPLARLVPVENTAMPERTVIQWDKDDLDAVGLMKVDVLALGMLSALRRMLDLLGERHGRPWRLDDIPSEDPATYEMLCHADSMGVFQVESRAQMAMLPRLRPRQYYDLVVEVALVRPGPIQGEMVHPYLKRRQGREAIERISDQRSNAVLAADLWRADLPGTGHAAGHRRRRFHARARPTSCAAAMAAWRRKGNLQTLPGQVAGRDAEKRSAGRICRADRPADPGLWRIRLSPNHMRPVSHCWSTPRPGSSAIDPEAFLCGLLNGQPMGFYSAFPAGPGCPPARRYRVAAGCGGQ